MMLAFVIVGALALAAAPPTDAEPRASCASYVGTTIEPVAVDAAILQLAKTPKLKGEYETSARFAAREAAAKPTTPLIIGKPIDLKYVRYDADTQMLNVSLFALDNANVSYADVFGYGTPFDGKVKYARSATSML